MVRFIRTRRVMGHELMTSHDGQENNNDTKATWEGRIWSPRNSGQSMPLLWWQDISIHFSTVASTLGAANDAPCVVLPLEAVILPSVWSPLEKCPS